MDEEKQASSEDPSLPLVRKKGLRAAIARTALKAPDAIRRAHNRYDKKHRKKMRLNSDVGGFVAGVAGLAVSEEVFGVASVEILEAFWWLVGGQLTGRGASYGVYMASPGAKYLAKKGKGFVSQKKREYITKLAKLLFRKGYHEPEMIEKLVEQLHPSCKESIKAVNKEGLSDQEVEKLATEQLVKILEPTFSKVTFSAVEEARRAIMRKKGGTSVPKATEFEASKEENIEQSNSRGH